MIVVSVVRDNTMYARCVVDNPFLSCPRVVLDNTTENCPIPIRYNQFLGRDDFGQDVWLLFCHEDFELREDLCAQLASLDRSSVYGFAGSKRVGFWGLGVQRIYGVMKECSRDGSGDVWCPGRPAPTGKVVETLDCCSLLVHSSLVRKYGLRFDEQLEYDLYVEDFCASVKVKYGIKSRIIALESCHHSGSRPSERLYRHLPYLKKKYPRNCFSATCAYFGTEPFLMHVENWLIGRRRV